MPGKALGKGWLAKTETNLAQSPECQCLGSNTVCVTGIDKIQSQYSVYHNRGRVIPFIMLKIMWKTFGSAPQLLEMKPLILSDFSGWAEEISPGGCCVWTALRSPGVAGRA